MRTVHLLTRRVENANEGFRISLQLGPLGAATSPASLKSERGVLIGAGDGVMDYRAAAIIHHWNGPGGGIFVGVDGQGAVFVRNHETGEKEVLAEAPSALQTPIRDVRLEIEARPIGEEIELTAEVRDSDSDAKRSRIS